MKANPLLMNGRPAAAPDGDGSRNALGRGHDRRWWLALVALCQVLTGCQSFNYTDEDMARERRKLAEGWANGGWRNWGCSLSGMKISPNLSNIGCPGLRGGVVCPGK